MPFFGWGDADYKKETIALYEKKRETSSTSILTTKDNRVEQCYQVLSAYDKWNAEEETTLEVEARALNKRPASVPESDEDSSSLLSPLKPLDPRKQSWLTMKLGTCLKSCNLQHRPHLLMKNV